MSERVSRKVRELDTAQSRINDTLQSIDCVVKRTNAVDGIQQALQSQDYEAAAGYVDTLLESEESYGKAHNGYLVQPNEQQSMVSACLVTGVVPDMDHGTQHFMQRYTQAVSWQVQVLAEARKQLTIVVQKRVQEAIENQDHDDVVRFVRLYVPLRLKVQFTSSTQTILSCYVTHFQHRMVQSVSFVQPERRSSATCRQKALKSSLHMSGISWQQEQGTNTVLSWRAQVYMLL